jgi:hypothetical protein
MRKAAVVHVLASLVVSGLLVGVESVAGGTLVGEPVTPLISSCSQDCLLKVMAGFKSDVLAKKPVALAPTSPINNVGIAEPSHRALSCTVSCTGPPRGRCDLRNVRGEDAVSLASGQAHRCSVRHANEDDVSGCAGPGRLAKAHQAGRRTLPA